MDTGKIDQDDMRNAFAPTFQEERKPRQLATNDSLPPARMEELEAAKGGEVTFLRNVVSGKTTYRDEVSSKHGTHRTEYEQPLRAEERRQEIEYQSGFHFDEIFSNKKLSHDDGMIRDAGREWLVWGVVPLIFIAVFAFAGAWGMALIPVALVLLIIAGISAVINLKS